MKEEARRLEAEAAAQAAARRQVEEQIDVELANDVDRSDETETGSGGISTVAENEAAANVLQSDGAVDRDVAALAMRRKVERDREAAAKIIQQRVRGAVV